MPLTYRLNSKLRLIETTAEGHVTFAEVRDHQNRLLSDPAFDSTFDQLIDMTAATGLDLSAAQARQIADRKVVSHASRRAFVAPLPAMYGMGRLMQVYHERHAQVRVFRDRRSALEWLGIEDTELLAGAQT